jgi:hypothetical protein
VLGGKCHVSPAATLALLNAGDAMVAAVIHLHLAISCVYSQALFIGEESAAGFVMTAEGSHNLKVVGSNPTSATTFKSPRNRFIAGFASFCLPITKSCGTAFYLGAPPKLE